MSKPKREKIKLKQASTPQEVEQPYPSKNRRKKTISLLTVCLAIICLILYANTLKHEYCYDDRMFITENEITQKGFDGISEHLQHSFLYGYMHQEGYDAGSSHWRPTTLITFALEIGIWGPGKPANSHLVNVLLYIFIVVFLFQVLHKYILKDTWLSFFTTLLFAVHPVHTEVVANIKGRDELLCLLTLLISLRFLFRFIVSKNYLHYSLSLVLFFISLCTKENSLTFLAGIPLLLYYFSDVKGKTLISYSAGYFLTAAIFMFIRNSIVPLSLSGMTEDVTNNPYLFATGTEELSTKVYVMLQYLKLSVFPYELTSDYSYNHLPYVNAANPQVWFSILIYGSLFFYAIKGLKSKTTLSAAIFLFFITMSISTNFVMETGVMMAERMLFIPSIFITMILAIAGKKALIFLSDKFHWNLRVITAIVVIPAVILASLKTISRNRDWKNDITLTLADVTTSPESARINFATGSIYSSLANDPNNNSAVRDSLFQKSLNYYNKATRIYPKLNVALIGMAVVYGQVDSVPQAERALIIARANDPNHPDLYAAEDYIGKLSFNKGFKLSEAKMFDSAIVCYQKTIRFLTARDPIRFQAMNNLGNAYYNIGEFKKAKDVLLELKNLDANYPNVQASLDALDRLLLQQTQSKNTD